MHQMPVPDASDESFSKTVLVYGEAMNDVGLGYFDFEMREWLHLGENTFLLKCWCYLPNPKTVVKKGWAVIAPKGFQKTFL